MFCDGSRRDAEKLKEILDLYCLALDMVMNIGKSSISFSNISEREKYFFSRMFPFSVVDMQDGIGIKCLGFYLKPDDYTKMDWGWMIVKVEKRLTLWCNRLLSRGERLILVKFVFRNDTGILGISVCHS